MLTINHYSWIVKKNYFILLIIFTKKKKKSNSRWRTETFPKDRLESDLEDLPLQRHRGPLPFAVGSAEKARLAAPPLIGERDPGRCDLVARFGPRPRRGRGGFALPLRLLFFHVDKRTAERSRIGVEFPTVTGRGRPGGQPRSRTPSLPRALHCPASAEPFCRERITRRKIN